MIKDTVMLSGAGLMLLSRLSIKAIGLVSSIILARLLVPEDFGLVAIAMSIYAFLELMGSFGLSTVLIHRDHDVKEEYDTAWTFQVIFGVVSALLLVILAPYVATFYADPRLQNILYTIAVMAMLNGLQNIGVVGFQKQLQFKKELIFQLIPKLLSFFLTLYLAYTLRDYWALVYGMLASSAIGLITSFVMHAHRPVFTLKARHSLFGFSKWLLGNNVLAYFVSRLPELTIGRMISAQATGLFVFAREIGMLPSTELAAPVNRATFPIYTKHKHDKNKLASLYAKVINLSASLTFPASIGIIFVIPEFIQYVLGEKWIGAIVIVQGLALNSLLTSLFTNNNYIFVTFGKPEITFKIESVRLLFLAPGLPFCILQWGVNGAVIALLATTAIALILSQFTLKKMLCISNKQIAQALVRPAIASVIMFLALYILNASALFSANIWHLIANVVSGVTIYLIVLFLVWRAVGKPSGIEQDILDRLKNPAQ